MKDKKDAMELNLLIHFVKFNQSKFKVHFSISMNCNLELPITRTFKNLWGIGSRFCLEFPLYFTKREVLDVCYKVFKKQQCTRPHLHWSPIIFDLKRKIYDIQSIMGIVFDIMTSLHFFINCIFKEMYFLFFFYM